MKLGLRTMIIVVIFSIGICLPRVLFADTVDESKLASSEIVATISEVATFKLAVLGYNKVAPQNSYTIKIIAMKFASKYKIDIENAKFTIDKDVGLFVTPMCIDMYLPTMTVICSVENAEKVPDIKFKGEIKLPYDSMSATFSDKTECLFDGKEYMFLNGKWYKK